MLTDIVNRLLRDVALNLASNYAILRTPTDTFPLIIVRKINQDILHKAIMVALMDMTLLMVLINLVMYLEHRRANKLALTVMLTLLPLFFVLNTPFNPDGYSLAYSCYQSNGFLTPQANWYGLFGASCLLLSPLSIILKVSSLNPYVFLGMLYLVAFLTTIAYYRVLYHFLKNDFTVLMIMSVLMSVFTLALLPRAFSSSLLVLLTFLLLEKSSLGLFVIPLFSTLHAAYDLVLAYAIATELYLKKGQLSSEIKLRYLIAFVVASLFLLTYLLAPEDFLMYLGSLYLRLTTPRSQLSLMKLLVVPSSSLLAEIQVLKKVLIATGILMISVTVALRIIKSEGIIRGAYVLLPLALSLLAMVGGGSFVGHYLATTFFVLPLLYIRRYGNSRVIEAGVALGSGLIYLGNAIFWHYGILLISSPELLNKSYLAVQGMMSYGIPIKYPFTKNPIAGPVFIAYSIEKNLLNYFGPMISYAQSYYQAVLRDVYPLKADNYQFLFWDLTSIVIPKTLAR